MNLSTDDSGFFDIAHTELKNETYDRSLWRKAMALMGSNEEKAKEKYIRLRIKTLTKHTDRIKENTNLTTNRSKLQFVGIHLGISNASIATLNSIGQPEVIPNKEGERITPSVILFESDSKILVGQEAKNQASTDSRLVAKEFKREMHNDDYRFSVHEKSYSASELSSFILKKLTQDASKQVGPITDVVISVPAYFKESERNATIQAGELAGLNVIGIVNETTAIALYCKSILNIKGKCLVYYLGNNIFDVTIIQAGGKDIQIIASSGDHHLGGVDFDKAMLELMEEKYKAVKGGELYSDESSKHEFLLDAERLKKSLSTRSFVKEKLFGENGNVVLEFTQQEFEAKISTYISKTELLVEQVLDEAEYEAENIDYILVMGGNTHIPGIQKSIKNLMNKVPIKISDEAVVLGTAITSGLIMARENPNIVSFIPRDVIVEDKANHSIGKIENIFDKKLNEWIKINTIVLPKNCILPCSFTETIYTTEKKFKLQITQGEGEDPDFVNIIKNIELTLPENNSNKYALKITYSYDENQLFNCSITDLESNSIFNLLVKNK